MQFKYYFCLLLIFVISACNDRTDPEPGQSGTNVEKTVTIDIGKTFQTIDGFGASDCWTANYVGRDWEANQKESIARLLFSQDINNGTPEGIGLSMWRFNLGAGTAEQGDDSGIDDKSRRAESFLNADGTYDWSRQQGQQYFLEKAREYGCGSFVMFSNSPPVHYTYNGKGFSARGARSNLKEEHYDDFAAYMANVAEYFKNNKNITFSYISPVNEPQYNWESGQEGSGWQNAEIKRLVMGLDNALSRKNLDSRILITESGDWEYLYKIKGDAARSNQITEFFSPESANYIGDLTHVELLIGGHSYWTDGNWDTMKSVRSQLGAAASAKGLKIYQTEWSMLGDHFNDKDYPGHESATPLDIALHMSKVIYHDLTTANVSSWSFWTSMDMARWDHKNRFLLIDLVPGSGIYGDISESGRHEATKSLWVLGNYSLFIRPGYQRVDLSIENPSSSFFGSAWMSPDKKRLVVVYTNMTGKSIAINLNVTGLGRHSSVKQYTTSRTKDLGENTPSGEETVIDPLSVTTFVYEF
ncbi:putative Galactan endo-1,6-beta-galactosidase [Proteiniphilum saccharofermentans]|uniref:Putative Galactan endo-1,6-beta-galactosidase n=1 Tax=Proteiniphilum saccharofermentans TaxID=1642647 RepID=A0A1R3STW0_9BACT|nr:glycoside hydrolase [Proteiniphilum saccharofermentans]SCD19763.1 putative Galactan endo-1,6-beta-galactosidase [Proteiniphilum saccharofermentans]